MKKKSEASKAIMKEFARLELALGKTLKPYHCDNAKKQKTKSLLDNLQENGTITTTTAPYSSQ